MKVYLLASFMAYEGFTLLGVYADKDSLMEAAQGVTKYGSYHKDFDDLNWAEAEVGASFDEMSYVEFPEGVL